MTYVLTNARDFFVMEKSYRTAIHAGSDMESAWESARVAVSAVPVRFSVRFLTHDRHGCQNLKRSYMERLSDLGYTYEEAFAYVLGETMSEQDRVRGKRHSLKHSLDVRYWASSSAYVEAVLRDRCKHWADQNIEFTDYGRCACAEEAYSEWCAWHGEV